MDPWGLGSRCSFTTSEVSLCLFLVWVFFFAKMNIDIKIQRKVIYYQIVSFDVEKNRQWIGIICLKLLTISMLHFEMSWSVLCMTEKIIYIYIFNPKKGHLIKSLHCTYTETIRRRIYESKTHNLMGKCLGA